MEFIKAWRPKSLLKLIASTDMNLISHVWIKIVSSMLLSAQTIIVHAILNTKDASLLRLRASSTASWTKLSKLKKWKILSTKESKKSLIFFLILRKNSSRKSRKNSNYLVLTKAKKTFSNWCTQVTSQK